MCTLRRSSFTSWCRLFIPGKTKHQQTKFKWSTSWHLKCEFMEFYDWLAEAKLSNPQLNFDVADDKGNNFADLIKGKE